eukprot:m.295862 g.295862  ORF g.295862 m.295862 type:complete len:227 (+) comp16272_c2_seq14:806-1486(+)
MIDAILLDCKAATVFAAAGGSLELKRLSETPVPLHMPTTTFVATVKDVWLLELAASLQDVLPTDYIHGSACKKLVGCAKTLVDKPTATRIETFKDHLNNVLRTRPTTWKNRAETYKDGLGYFSFDFFSDVLRVLTSVHLQACWPGSPPVFRSQDLLTEEEVTELLTNPIFDRSATRSAQKRHRKEKTAAGQCSYFQAKLTLDVPFTHCSQNCTPLQHVVSRLLRYF